MIKPVGATTVTAYMAQLDDSRKKQIKTLHNMIRKAVLALKPGIVAGMIGYGNKASIGKSCIRFKKLEDVDLGLMQKIVEAGARVMAEKYSAA